MKLSLLALNSDRTVLGFFYDRESGSEPPSTYDRAIKLNLHRSIMISSFLTYGIISTRRVCEKRIIIRSEVVFSPMSMRYVSIRGLSQNCRVELDVKSLRLLKSFYGFLHDLPYLSFFESTFGSIKPITQNVSE